MKDILKTFNRDGIPIIVAIIIIASLFVSIRRTDLQQQRDEEMIKFRTHHAAILEDVINDIYENDREYFDKNIATSEHFDSLRSLYRDEFKRDPKTITWDDMYNY